MEKSLLLLGERSWNLHFSLTAGKHIASATLQHLEDTSMCNHYLVLIGPNEAEQLDERRHRINVFKFIKVSMHSELRHLLVLLY